MIRRILTVLVFGASALPAASSAGEVRMVGVSDGVDIAVECEGAGDTLLIVHGGTGDRGRWTPMLPLLAPHLQVCAMDRRAHGQSGDSPQYSIEREAMDVAEVADSFRRPVAVLGHSYGGVAALEAALLTDAISRLVLYEPPLQDGDHSAAAAEIERQLAAGNPAAAAETFLTQIVQVSPAEIEQMKARPTWAGLVGSMGTVLRQDRALGQYRWDPERIGRLAVPTLLLIGERTQSPQLRLAIDGLEQALPNDRLVVLAGQEHNAMDTARDSLARIVLEFLQGTRLAPQ